MWCDACTHRWASPCLCNGCACRYFLSPKTAVIQDLTTRADNVIADVGKVKEQREAIDQKQKDTEAQLRELISTTPEIARRFGAVAI